MTSLDSYFRTANKLGIPPEAFQEDVNEGFYEFAKEHHLANYLKTHNHQLETDKATHEVKILHKGEYRRWSSLKPIIERFQEENLQKFDIKEPYSWDIYGYQGIQNRDRYQWKKLEPLLKGPTHLWANHFIKDPLIFDANSKGYLMEMCSSATEKAPRTMAGDHSWVRLTKYKKNINNDEIFAKLFSIGKYRPHKQDFYLDSVRSPFTKKRAYLIGEISEVWNMNEEIISIAIRIDQEAYKNIKKKIQTDQDAGDTVFHLFDNNCDGYVSDLAKLGNFSLNTKRHFLELFAVMPLQQQFKCLQTIPRPVAIVAQAITYLSTPLFNFGFYCLGSGWLHEEIKKTTLDKPAISKVSDLFNYDKLCPSSPWVLANDVKNDIESWREAEMAKLDLNTLEGQYKQKELMYDFPDSYKIRFGAQAKA